MSTATTRKRAAAATAPDAIEETTFDASSYELPVPKIDGERATTLDVRLSGSGKLDRTSVDDLALLRASRMRAEVMLLVRGTVDAKSFRVSGDGIAYSCTVKVSAIEAAGTA